MNWISLNSMIRKWFRRKPLNVLEGGTGANTFEKACENLGAVKKTGDIITGNLEFYGESGDNSFIHPVVNAKAGDKGIDVVIGGSNNESSLVVGCGRWANEVAEKETNPEEGNLSLTANDSIRLFQKRTRTVKNENNEDQTEDYLAERWRFNTSGYLQHRNTYDQKDYHPFQCRRTYDEKDATTGEIQEKDAIAGSLRLNSSIGQPSTTSYIQGQDNTLFGIQAYCKSNTNISNCLLLGAKAEKVDNKTVNKRIVSFRTGLDNGTYDSMGKATAEAWRAALISDKGYGISGNDSTAAKAWRNWILPWTVLANRKTTTPAEVTNVSKDTTSITPVAKYIIPDNTQELLIYGRSQKSYTYGSTLIIPKNVVNSINANGRVFTLGGGWNSNFGGDAAKIKLTREVSESTGKNILTLFVLGVSVGGEWVDNSWVVYYR